MCAAAAVLGAVELVTTKVNLQIWRLMLELQRVWGRSHLSLAEKIDTYFGLIPKVGPLIIYDNQGSQQKREG